MTWGNANEAEALQQLDTAKREALGAVMGLGAEVRGALTPELVISLTRDIVNRYPDEALSMGETRLANLLRGLEARRRAASDKFSEEWNRQATAWPKRSAGPTVTQGQLRDALRSHLEKFVVEPLTEAFKGAGFFGGLGPFAGMPQAVLFEPAEGLIREAAEYVEAVRAAEDAVDDAMKRDKAEAVEALWQRALGTADIGSPEAVRTAPPPESSE